MKVVRDFMFDVVINCRYPGSQRLAGKPTLENFVDRQELIGSTEGPTRPTLLGWPGNPSAAVATLDCSGDLEGRGGVQDSGISLRRLLWVVSLGFLLVSLLPARGNAWQSACPQIVKTEAIAGEPYGVGMVSFRLPPRGPQDAVDPNLLVRTGAINLTEQNNRIFYLAEGRPPAARFFRSVFGRSENPGDELLTIWFLFRGAEPLNISLWGCEGVAVKVELQNPRQNKFQRLLKQWWREFQLAQLGEESEGDFPDLVSVYLCHMLANRFNLEPPSAPTVSTDPLSKTIELLTDIDPLSSQLIHDWFAGQQGLEARSQPLPAAIPWSPVRVENLPAEIPIEPIAHYVPEDCFYLRFGTWDNQVWLKRLTEEHGGDLSRMIRLRGFRAKVQSKFLNQLALESSQIDQWFGGNLIADVAVIGRDTYFETGPAVGVILHAKDSQALRTRIERRRATFAADTEKTAELKTVEIAGQSVTLIATPDHRFRSYYVVAEDMHLFTNSWQIATSFLTCRANQSSLGSSPEFQYLRTTLPIDRNDTIFAYFSTKFFQKLLEPQYQIELYRRSQAITEMQLVQLAQMAAQNEGAPAITPEFLIANRFLPTVFAQRAADSTIRVDQGIWRDADRGQRGFFLPIADAPAQSATPSEVAWYQARGKFFAENVRQIDPMVIAVQRYQKDSSVERIAFDARLAPFGQEKYGWITSMLGPPLKYEVIGNENELFRMQLSIQGGVWQRNVPPHQIFAAVSSDVNPLIDLNPSSFFDTWRTLKQVPGYLGAWPKPGTLDWLPRLGGSPDPEGYTYSRFLDLWRLQFGDFSVLAFDKSQLEQLRGKLAVVPTTRPVQMKLNVGDLSRSDLDGWAKVLNYRRAWETSIANTQLLHSLVKQFGIAPESALARAEELLDVKLVCSLGGEYQMLDLPGRKIWISTAWPDFSNPSIPDNYRAPVLTWFRGLEVELIQLENQYSLHGFLDLERSASTAGNLPSFDIFKGFQSLLPGTTEKK